jgi:uncharacterized membrane protein
MIIDFFGNFHPLFVHLPIGFLVLAILLQIIFFKTKNDAIPRLMPLILLLSFLSAVFSSITGYILLQTGGYEIELAEKHQYSGILLTIFTGLLYFLRNYKTAYQLGWVLVSIMLGVTGHLGGSLTHGEDFLTLKAPQIEKKPIVNIQEAIVYSEVIVPILESKCYACHSSSKQKGDLRLDNPTFILKGGESPDCLVPNQPQKSLILTRMLLEPSEEEHMPPKGKPQPTEAEIKIISWWIEQGAPFDKKVKDLSQPASITPFLTALQKAAITTPKLSTLPEEEVSKPSEKTIRNLTEKGIVVLPVSISSNYLSVNISGKKQLKIEDIQLLESLKNNIVWLKASDLQIGEELLKSIGKLKNLRILHLSNVIINDLDLENLRNLENLQSLNLSGTAVSTKGILSIKNLQNLNKIYLYNTKINKNEWVNLQKAFPNAVIDSGGYKVPTFESDTTQLEY